MSAHVLNQSAVTAVLGEEDGSDEATIVQMRDEMDANIHQIRHLIRSQRELREYVLTDNDAVFTEVEPALTLLYYAYIVLHGPV
jgi:hypothetical protein